MAGKKKYAPTLIEVGGINFKIIYKELEDFGQMDFDKKTIYIRKGMSSEDNFDTLMHEVLHAALSVSGISYVIDEDKLEEGIIRCVDHLLFPIYKKEIKKL